MTAIAAVFGARGASAEPEVRAMLAAMADRGAERRAVVSREGAVVGVTRDAWQSGTAFAGQTLVGEAGDLIVVADASVYYRDDLRRALRDGGQPEESEEPSALILAAYRAWGDAAPARLEGDFAWLVWDRQRARLCAARDFSASRPLHYALIDGTLVVASSVAGVLAHPRCPRTVNLPNVGAVAAGLFADAEQTAWEAVRSVPAGHTLTWSAKEGVRVTRHWTVPEIETGRGPAFEEAAVELRRLLQAAAAERTVPNRETGVWLSGGYDSTAIYACTLQAIRESGADNGVRPVSVQYPKGDAGYEDDYIQAVTDQWGQPTRFLPIESIPFFDRPVERALTRTEPFAHPYEMFNRALARTSRSEGARVALVGKGGDELFSTTSYYIADLLRRGRLVAFAREWMRRPGKSVWSFVHYAVAPSLPLRVRKAAAVVRGGRPLHHYLDRVVPAWIRPDFLRKHRIVEHEEAHTPRVPRGGVSANEAHWALSYAFNARVFQEVADIALSEGVEIRTPIFDARVIAFALSRPREERAAGTQTKYLLRRAMRGLLPDGVLAARRTRTGVTTTYMANAMTDALDAQLTAVLAAPVLDAAGVIDGAAFREAWASGTARAGGLGGLSLFLTLQAELWSRGRIPAHESARTAPEATVAGVAS